MSNLQIFNQNGKLLVDSREIAEMVEKNHADLLRDIRKYMETLGKSNFALADFFIESYYNDTQSKPRPHYFLTRKGCDMVANKMTGEKGILFTATYVTKFEEMEKKLQPQSIEDLIIMQAQSMKEIRQQLESTKTELATAHTEITDIKQGLVDINEPLRKQFNDAVRAYKVKANIGNFDTAYNNVYNLLNAQHHLNIQKRAENKNVRKIDIVEELNLLVPGIRLAKSLSE